MNSRWIPLIGVSLALAACTLKKDRFGRTAELAGLPEPITLKDVSFHVRMAMPEAEIIAQAAKRGLVLDGDPRQALASVNAPPSLIANLATSEILLTKRERDLYERRLTARNANRTEEEQTAQAFLDDRKAELNRSLDAQRRAALNARRTELAAKAAAVRNEQSREKYSASSNTPYQRRQEEIDAIQREISAIDAKLAAKP